MWYGIFLDFTVYEYCWPIVEPVEPPKPKTEDVVLNKYLVGIDGRYCVMVATAEYMDTYYYDYKLIGHSETVTIEVE